MPTLKLVLSGIVFVVASIAGNARYQVGAITNLRCSTPVPVPSIQWVAKANNTLMNMAMGVKVLELRFQIADMHNNTEYRCIVSDQAFMTSTSILLSIGCKLALHTVLLKFT